MPLYYTALLDLLVINFNLHVGHIFYYTSIIHYIIITDLCHLADKRVLPNSNKSFGGKNVKTQMIITKWKTNTYCLSMGGLINSNFASPVSHKSNHYNVRPFCKSSLNELQIG